MTEPAPTKSLPPSMSQPPPPERGLPPLLRFLALHLGVGVGIGVAFAALIVLGNVGRLKELLVAAENPWLAMFLLYFMCSLTFGSLSMGIAVMTMPYDDKDAQNGAEDGSEDDRMP